jgi:hypothetical protein
MADPHDEPTLRISRRRLPHWHLDGSTYFVTFRLLTGTLARTERVGVLGHIRNGDGRFYHLAAAVVMPDHVHIVLRPLPGYSLSRVMRGIKGVSAHLVNTLRGIRGVVWQDESYDRIIRDSEELAEKLNYMLTNPAKAGLCAEGESYEGWYCNPGFEEGRQECLPHQDNTRPANGNP